MVSPTHMDIMDLANGVVTRDVVLTGGEPLLHDLEALLGALTEHGCHITIETNATKFCEDPRVGLWSLSPKLGTSGHRPDVDVIARFLALEDAAIQLKFVVGSAEDVLEIRELLSALPGVIRRRVPVILQPVGIAGESRDDYCARLRRMAEEVAADQFWREYALQVLPQLHRLLWQDQRGI